MKKSSGKHIDEVDASIYALKNDIDKRIKNECEIIKTTANPRKEVEKYFRNLRWETPELAVYVKKVMSDVLDTDRR